MVGITNDPQVKKMLIDAVQGVWAFGQANSSLYSSAEAASKVIGDIEDWNGKKIIMPKRANGESYKASTFFAADFSDLIEAKQAELRKQTGYLHTVLGKTSLQYIASNLPVMQLQSISNGNYYILDPKLGYVRNPDGTPYVLNVMPKEQK